MKELREVSAGDDSAAIKSKIEDLQKEVMAIGQVRFLSFCRRLYVTELKGFRQCSCSSCKK